MSKPITATSTQTATAVNSTNSASPKNEWAKGAAMNPVGQSSSTSSVIARRRQTPSICFGSIDAPTPVAPPNGHRGSHVADDLPSLPRPPLKLFGSVPVSNLTSTSSVTFSPSSADVAATSSTPSVTSTVASSQQSAQPKKAKLDIHKMFNVKPQSQNAPAHSSPSLAPTSLLGSIRSSPVVSRPPIRSSNLPQLPQSSGPAGAQLSGPRLGHQPPAYHQLPQMHVPIHPQPWQGYYQPYYHPQDYSMSTPAAYWQQPGPPHAPYLFPHQHPHHQPPNSMPHSPRHGPMSTLPPNNGPPSAATTPINTAIANSSAPSGSRLSSTPLTPRTPEFIPSGKKQIRITNASGEAVTFRPPDSISRDKKKQARRSIPIRLESEDDRRKRVAEEARKRTEEEEMRQTEEDNKRAAEELLRFPRDETKNERKPDLSQGQSDYHPQDYSMCSPTAYWQQPSSLSLEAQLIPSSLVKEGLTNLSDSAIRMLSSEDMVSVIYSITEKTLPLPSGSPKERRKQRTELESLLRALRTQERAKLEGSRRKGTESVDTLHNNAWHEQGSDGRKQRIQRADAQRRKEDLETLEAVEQARVELEIQLQQERLRVLELEQQQLKQEREAKLRGLCVICQDGEGTYSILDCGHMCLCQECSVQVVKSTNPRCPICRSEVRTVIRIFRS